MEGATDANVLVMHSPGQLKDALVFGLQDFRPEDRGQGTRRSSET